MAITFTIGGVDRTSYVTQFSSRRAVNAVGDATIVVIDRSGGTYIPAKWDTVLVTDGATTIFAGYVAERDVRFALKHKYAQATLRVLDYNAYLDRALRNGIETTGLTLKQHLQALVTDNLMTPYGTTLDAGQATGPTFTTALTHVWSTARQVLDYLSLLTGYLYDVNASNVLEAWAVGSRTAATALTSANRNILDIAWSDSIGEHMNAGWLSFGGTQQLAVTDTHNGDGSARTFVMRYYASTGPVTVTVDRVASAPTTEPCGIYGVDTMEWTFDVATRTLHHSVSYTVLAVGDTVAVSFLAQFPMDIYDEDAADIASHKATTRHLTRTDITDADEAAAYLAASVRRRVVAPRQLHVRTRTSEYDPGVLVSATVAPIGLTAADYFVSETRAAYLQTKGGHYVFYEVDLVADVERPRSWLDWWKERAAGASASVGSGASSGGGGSTTVTIIGAGHIWGAARSRALMSASWANVEDYIDYIAKADGDVVVKVDTKTDNATTSVTPRIYDVTSAAVAGGATPTGIASTSTSWSEQTLTFTAVTGHRYRLQVIGSNATYAIRAVGVS